MFTSISPTTLSIFQSQKFRKPPLILILLGPPGVGKGTQSEMLSKTLHLPHISTGDLLRANIKEETPLGKMAKDFVDRGSLVSDSLILDMLFDRVSKQDCERGYILDGFPRTIAQAISYHNLLQAGAKVFAFNLSLSPEDIIERLSQRVICQECNAPYHLIDSPSKKEGVCDACQGALIQRSDDREEVIRKRLVVYKEQTAPLIAYYAKKNLLKEICCNRDMHEVFNQILRYIAID